MLRISWDQFHKDVNDLALKLNGNPCAEWPILAIGRGGLVPAVMLSHMLGNGQRVYGFDHQSYEGADKATRIWMQKWPPFEKGAFEELLVVDDLVDSGATLYNMRGVLTALDVQRFETAVVYLRNWDVASTGAVWFGRVVNTTEWIEFPYEKSVI